MVSGHVLDVLLMGRVADSAFVLCKLLRSVIVAFLEEAIACFSVAGMITEVQAFRTVCLLTLVRVRTSSRVQN